MMQAISAFTGTKLSISATRAGSVEWTPKRRRYPIWDASRAATVRKQQAAGNNSGSQ